MTYCRPFRFILAALCLLLTAALHLPAETVVCTSCGYENEASAGLCSHCAATWPVVASTEQATTEPGTSSPFPFDPVTAEFALARDQAAGKNPGVAYYLLRNAAALSLVATPIPTNSGGTELVAQAGKQLGRLTQGNAVCPLCTGTGKTRESTVTTQGSKSAFSRTCEKCDGTGQLERPATVDEIKIALGEARRDYDALQRARRSTPLGDAWLPEGWLEQLTRQQQIMIRQAVAAPCAGCAGTGRDDCEKCGNNGLVRCSNSKCQNGKIDLTRDPSITLSRQTRALCTVCEGSGQILCTTCKGKGTVTCDDCDGSGKRDTCSTCHGAGEADCRRCRGSGQYKGEDCSSCDPTGKTLCSKCSGDGFKP